MNGSFCFFFQKEALGLVLILLDGAGSPRRRGRLAMTALCGEIRSDYLS
jgi:hypothetical protein